MPETASAGRSSAAYQGRGAPALIALLCAILALSGCQASSSGAWQNLGPSDGSVTLSMTVDASHRLMYAGSSSGTVYRGAVPSSKFVATRGIPRDAAVSALAADPQRTGAVYAGTSRGLFVSADYGEHWQARGQGLPADDGIGALAARPTAGAATPVLYAGTQQHGVLDSHDGGATWAASNSGLPDRADIYGLTYESATSTLFAALVAGGVYVSRDDGQTWVRRSDGLPASSDTFVVLALSGAAAPADQPALYAGTSKGLFASVDGGQTWQPRAAGLGTPRVLALAPDPTQPNALYAGTDDSVYQSTDGGQRWSKVAPGITQHVAAVAVLADTRGHPVVFAGAGDILRFPSGPATSPLSRIVGGIIVLVLLGAAFLWYRRMLKVVQRVPARSPSASAGRSGSTRLGPPTSDLAERGASDGPTPSSNGHRPDGSG